MRPLMLLAAVLVLSACGSDGTLKHPSQMTPAERCDNAALALAAVEVGAPEGSVTVRRAREDYFLLCQNF